MRTTIHLFSMFLFVAGCGGLSPSLDVPHEDPEPIGSAPWEIGDSAPTDPSSSPEADSRARTEARSRKSGHSKHEKASSPPSPTPTSAPTTAPAKLDTDGDGIEDARDMCPRQPGADDPNPAYAGCPYDAPPRPTPSQYQELELVFGDTPRALDTKESDVVRTLSGELKSEPTVSLSTYARTQKQGDGWLKIVKAALVEGGVDPSRIVTQVCLQKSGLTHTTVGRSKPDCQAP